MRTGRRTVRSVPLARAVPLALTLALSFAPRTAAGEQLPLKIYTAADGLASDLVHCILSDSHGFLWFGTAEGISRFDGYGFANLTESNGLPGSEVRSILESRDGTYWAATNAGVYHWDPARVTTGPHLRREVIHVDAGRPGDEVRSLLEDRSGTLWVGTLEGLWYLEKGRDGGRFRRVALERPAVPEEAVVHALCEDRDGNLWIGTGGGLFRRSPIGSLERIAAPDGSPHWVQSLLAQRHGPLWVGSRHEGIFEIRRGPGKGGTSVRRVLSRENGLLGDYITTLFEASDGKIWAGCFPGVTEISADRRSLRSYTSAEGVAAIGIFSLAEDRNGNLWFGSGDGGAMRLARDGFRRFDSRDGLASTCVDSLFEDQEGEICAFTRGTHPDEIAVDRSFVECFDGTRFHAQEPRLRPGVSFGWGMSQIVLQDGGREWWVPSLGGLYRFPAVAFPQLGSTAPRKVYQEREGLPSHELFRLFQDAGGNIWIGFGEGDRSLALWDRATDSFRTFSSRDGVPPDPPWAFAQDAAGAVWIGFRSGLARYRNGTMRFFRPGGGLPPGGIHALYRDRAGRLWIATGTGLARIERPEEENPHFFRYGAERGLAKANLFSVVQDLWGRIYVGTPLGVDRLDPHDGLVQHFTADDGVPHSEIGAAIRDRQGNLWFGSPQGLSRLQPVARDPRPAPDIRITRVLADGLPESLPDLGASEVHLRDLGPESSLVQIDFVAVDFAPGGRPRYQYRLEGIDPEWSPASNQRSVVYAHLAPGRYRFRARAIANEGSAGLTPAEVRFAVLAPFWRRPEFLAFFGVAAAALGLLLHRYRLKSALAVERVRMRVATELHDDVGAGLSEIAILSELARRQQGADPSHRTLSEIGDSARRLVDAMADIVWSTDPRNDEGSSLTQRIRLFAVNTLESQGIRWTLEVPPAFEARRLNPESRRQMLLLVQEALTNVARHSGCTHASIRIAPDAQGTVVVEIEDNGCGFSPSNTTAGHGLANMRTRAESLGGDLVIRSRPGEGTVVTARMSLRRL